MTNNEITIRRISPEDIPICLDVIHRSFKTVADEFGFTRNNCPGHTSFTPIEKLRKQYAEGRMMYLCYKEGNPCGYFSLPFSGEKGELDNLAVLPEYRHGGIGAEMVERAKAVARENGVKELYIGIIQESEKLRNWYMGLGFIPVGTNKFPGLPFTVEFMMMKL